MDFMKKVNELTEKVGEFAVDTYKTVSKKSNNLVQETKVKLIINEREDEIEGLYKEIGKNVYRLFQKGENVEDFTATCKMIQTLEEEKIELQDTILELKDLRRCNNCNDSVPKDTQFCPSCGYGSEENKAKKTKVPKKKSATEKEEDKKEPKMVKVEIKKPAKKPVKKEENKEEVKKDKPKKTVEKKVTKTSNKKAEK